MEELTECEKQHIEEAMKSFYGNDEHGWCSICDDIAKKLGFESLNIGVLEMDKLTAGDMTYDNPWQRLLHFLGFWKVPIYGFFLGDYQGYKWQWLGWNK